MIWGFQAIRGRVASLQQHVLTPLLPGKARPLVIEVLS